MARLSGMMIVLVALVSREDADLLTTGLRSTACLQLL